MKKFLKKLLHQRNVNKINFWEFFRYFIFALALESILIWFLGLHPDYEDLRLATIIIFGILSSFGILFLAVEVIRDIDESTNMIIGLISIVFLFVAYFAFQYWFLLVTEPHSFTELIKLDPINLFFHSTMIFLFNPLMFPVTKSAQLLVLTNAFGGFVLVAFILQNIWQFKHKINY
ncbi:MAG: hypothetical protein NTY12_04595 [Candidatus Falkowbacteria bacterium]|nr:hypothetical protein [Candidatus Falkowbacteria bacterium]